MPIQPYKPEWAPENAGDEFASRVVPGISGAVTPDIEKSMKPNMKTDEIARKVAQGNISILGQAITLIESNSEKHKQLAREILIKLLPKSGESLRIGITGAPGVGKSTLIESLGLHLCHAGHKLAVLAIDPSSSRSGGSILGDKTRMEKLSRQPNAFIRPSPAGGILGGVARKTREAILLCEAAGYDVIMIETVGVGQSEIAVRSMTDFFLLMMQPGAGDGLQGIKRGVMELADLLVINKADGDSINKAEVAKREFANALHLLSPATDGWNTEVMTCSALNNVGIREIWDNIRSFEHSAKSSGGFDKRRNKQLLDWMHSMIHDELTRKFYKNDDIKKAIPDFESKVLGSKVTPAAAVDELLKIM